MLTEQEFIKVFSWLPYRDDWPVNRNQYNDSIRLYYGNLIESLTNNKLFDSYYSEDGGLANYLELICYPHDSKHYKGNAIIVCVSLCSPVAAYGQTTLTKKEDFVGWDGLYSPAQTGIINDKELVTIENELRIF